MRYRPPPTPLRLGLAWILSAGCWTAAAGAEPSASRPVDFDRDIRPILSDKCFSCHGPDQGQREADLRLDTRDGLFADREGVRVIAPGDLEESELYRRITSDDVNERMPAPDSGKTLSGSEVALIRDWIAQGAKWKGHWAYEPPARPEVPGVDEAGFVANPVDRFILAKLREAGLRPSPQADRITLIRRLAFDLTGLPPSKVEVDAFVADRRPDAYEHLVDRLLASPHYGERMAMYWLDLVRFADTIGYHSDNPMRIAPYREYVIQSFNDNTPFDRFSIEQLAGDLLPRATLVQKVASGYNRLLMTTEEGGSQPKEYEAKYAADRVRNVSSVWLGATMGCCQCHDHKFDPYTTADFYRLAAFFADIREKAVGKRESGMPVPDERQAAELARLDGRIAELTARLATRTPELDEAQAGWEAEQGVGIDWQALAPRNYAAMAGSTLEELPDGSLRAGGAVADQETYTIQARTDLKGITAIRLEVLPDPALPGQGPGTAADGNFVLSEFKVAASGPSGPTRPVAFRRAIADFSQEKRIIAEAIDGKVETGWAIKPRVGRAHEAVFQAAEPIEAEGETTLTFTFEHRSKDARHNLGRFRLSATTTPNATDGVDLPPEIRSILDLGPSGRDEGQSEAVATYYRSITPLLRPVRDELAAEKKRKEQLLESTPKTLVSASGPERVMRILPRGNWLDESGEVVEPAVPGFLPRLSTGSGRATRLDLARWIVAPENPLTARATVNRLWKLFFGQGIVKTLDDLGSQGESPTHPELLDWLAVEFMERGWDVKQMVRLLVTSGSYRQASLPRADLKERDPYNRLIARQARFRLDAEMVRDNALAVGGLLSRRVGGESVKPYQPAGYWSQLNFPPRTYEADRGEDQYRRGLYTHWQRTFLHPSLQAFDAPTREECTADRTRSNIPQQALVLLNDPTYVEAARAFAGRILREGGPRARDRLAWAFGCCLSREPDAAEMWVLADLLERHGRHYASDPEAATKLLGAGLRPVPDDLDPAELAAWTSVARVLLNLHETITRD